MSAHRYALVAGGGTAGHLQPALSVAEALVAAGHDRTSIEFVGSRRGQDAQVLGDGGFPFTLLPGRGLVRSVRPGAVAANLGAAAGLAWAAVRAVAIVVRRRPAVVVSVGGYASLPASVAALACRVPLVLVNVDAVPGAANRLLGPFARAAAVGWEGTPLPHAVVTGTPVRPAIAALAGGSYDRADARRRLGLHEDRSTVVAMGGSLGARRINDAVAGLATRWADRGDLSILHVVGRRDWDGAEGTRAGAGDGLDYVRVAYEDRMELAYAAADVVVGRAGAMTVAELAVAGVPALLVPLPGAPGDHQTANARVLERAGGAVVVPDDACTADRLDELLSALLASPDRLAGMRASLGTVGRPDAAAAGASLVEAVARGGAGAGTGAGGRAAA